MCGAAAREIGSTMGTRVRMPSGYSKMDRDERIAILREEIADLDDLLQNPTPRLKASPAKVDKLRYEREQTAERLAKLISAGFRAMLADYAGEIENLILSRSRDLVRNVIVEQWEESETGKASGIPADDLLSRLAETDRFVRIVIPFGDLTGERSAFSFHGSRTSADRPSEGEEA
jgi:uncharacterized small protein (DUF1192 family)